MTATAKARSFPAGLFLRANQHQDSGELYLFLTNMTAIEYIRNGMKRVLKKESSFILASQNIEDFLLPKFKEFTKPPFISVLKPQNNGFQSYNYSFTNSILTLPLLLDTFSVFSPPSLLSGKLLSPFLISD